MKQLILSLFLTGLCLSALPAQTTVGLVAHYSFDGNLADATGNSANAGVTSGTVEFNCGVEDQSVRLDGANDFIRIPGGLANNNVNREFDTEDFTLSFYFQPTGSSGVQYLVSKRDTACDLQKYLLIRYAPGSRNLQVTLREDNQVVQLAHQIQNRRCWQHVTLIRANRRVRLYVNGEFAGDQGSTSRVDVSNTGDLLIGGGNCRAQGETSFSGLIDDFRIYNRALKEEEVPALYAAPDQIETQDVRLFLGESVDVSLGATCGSNFEWVPTTGVVPPNAADVTITPPDPGIFTYRVQVSDRTTGCVSEDSIRVQVIDPATLDCNEIFLPRAFTPNGQGPLANETFGISNPYAIPELLSFEIFDRWGGRMFYTEDVFDRWDGSFRSQPVNPGVYLYRLSYRCNGEEIHKTGSVTIIR